MSVFGIKVTFDEGKFSVIKESLERMGIVNKTTRTLYPSCYILKKRGEYYILHFKRLFLLDGKEANLSDEDELRESAIVKLLQDWGLVTINDDSFIVKDKYPIIFTLPYKDKKEYTISNKYKIGSYKG
jgi:hypothetical protein